MILKYSYFNFKIIFGILISINLFSCNNELNTKYRDLPNLVKGKKYDGLIYSDKEQKWHTILFINRNDLEVNGDSINFEMKDVKLIGTMFANLPIFSINSDKQLNSIYSNTKLSFNKSKTNPIKFIPINFSFQKFNNPIVIYYSYDSYESPFTESEIFPIKAVYGTRVDDIKILSFP